MTTTPLAQEDWLATAADDAKYAQAVVLAIQHAVVRLWVGLFKAKVIQTAQLGFTEGTYTITSEHWELISKITQEDVEQELALFDVAARGKPNPVIVRWLETLRQETYKYFCSRKGDLCNIFVKLVHASIGKTPFADFSACLASAHSIHARWTLPVL